MAKKKGGVKSAAIAAKEAELAREAEILRLQQEKERLRNEELELRQRIEEEERKVLDHLRVREETVANAIAERARQATFDALEKELLETLEMKDRDIQELKAKVLGLQMAHEALESDRESAVRRAAMLNNELELAQMKNIETEGQIEANEKRHQEVRRQLEGQYDDLQKAMSALRAEHDHLAKKHSELKDEMTNLPPPLSKQLDPENLENFDIKSLDPRSVDAETAVLLKVLHGEVNKYKEEALRLQGELDARGRDDEKSSLLVGIMNTQLDAVREENKRLHHTAQNRLREVEANQAFLDEEKRKNKQLYEELDRVTSEAAVQQRQLQLEIGVHKTQVSELTSRLADMSHQHQLLEAEHKDFVARATEREQEDFKTNVAMKTELMKQKEDLGNLLKEKQTMHDDSFNFKVLARAEMDSLKARLHKFEEEMERKERESYETITVLRADSEKNMSEKKLLTESFNAERTRLTDDLERYLKALNKLQREHEEIKRHSTHVQKDLYEKLTHMTACHDSKHEEVQRLRKLIEEKEKEYTNNAIFLNAQNENLRSKVQALQKDAEERREEHMAHVKAITEELGELQSRMTEELAQTDEVMRTEQTRAENAERNVKRLQEEIRQKTAEASTRKEENVLEVRGLKAEIKELRSELSIAKKTIERLEGAIGDQAGYKQLTELNEKLSVENEQYRSQISHLNSTIASMKMETDYLGDIRAQKMAEEKEQLTRRTNQLERLQKLTMPLMTELRAIVEKHGMTRAMQSALERYDSNVSRSGISLDGADAGGSESTSSSLPAAAAMGDAAITGSVFPTMLRPTPPAKRVNATRSGELPPL